MGLHGAFFYLYSNVYVTIYSTRLANPKELAPVIENDVLPRSLIDSLEHLIHAPIELRPPDALRARIVRPPIPRSSQGRSNPARIVHPAQHDVHVRVGQRRQQAFTASHPS